MSWMLVWCAALSWAAAPLDGTWTLDAKASESVGPLLELQGVSWATRKAADAVVPVLKISVDGQTVTVVSTTPKGKTTEVFVADGTPHATASPDGAPATWTTRWDGDALVSSRSVTVGDAPATLTLIRTRAGERLHQDVSLAVQGGPTVRVRRVFNPTAP